MEGLSHRDMLPPLWVGEGCSRIVFALYCCYTVVWIGTVCMYACMYEWMDIECIQMYIECRVCIECL